MQIWIITCYFLFLRAISGKKSIVEVAGIDCCEASLIGIK